MADKKPSDTIRFFYTFKFPDGVVKQFDVLLNASTLELITPKDLPKPSWTKLKYKQCEQCPLSDDVEHCPVAVNLGNLVETFKDSQSYEHTTVQVQTPERTYEKQTTLQKGLRSIIGIYMVTSNCPVMDKLRPMVKFHLPFGSLEETVYRAVSMYLTAQYLLMRKGKTPDWDLKKLTEIYKAAVQRVGRRRQHERRRHPVRLRRDGAVLDREQARGDGLHLQRIHEIRIVRRGSAPHGPLWEFGLDGGAQASPCRKLAGDAGVDGAAGGDEVLQDAVDGILVEDAEVAVGVDVHLQ